MSGSQNSIKKLLDAQTIQDVMQAGLPRKVGNIPDIDVFNTFAQGQDGEWSRFDRDEKFTPDANLVQTDHAPNDQPTPATDHAFDDVKRIISAHEVEAIGDRLSRSRLHTRANARASGLTGNIHTDVIDMQSPFRPIRARNYVASAQQSTLIVPDEAALEIVREFPFSEILDARLDNPADMKRVYQAYHAFSDANFEEDGFEFEENRLDPETVKQMKEMHKRLQACLEPTEDGTINLMSNISFHARNLPFAKGRVFFQAIGYDQAESKKDYGFDL